MREQIKIGKQLFKTQTALKTYVKELFKRRGVCSISDGDVDFLFLKELHARKPSHINCVEIKSFSLEMNAQYTRVEKMVSTDINNSIDCFSWNKCIVGKDTDPIAKLKVAFRSSILSQIKEKRNSSTECFLCKIKDNGDTKMEIDHHKKEFCKIYEEFIIGNVCEVPTEFDSNTLDMPIFKQENQNISNAFQEFHRREADLEMLCINCHNIKTNAFMSNIKTENRIKLNI